MRCIVVDWKSFQSFQNNVLVVQPRYKASTVMCSRVQLGSFALPAPVVVSSSPQVHSAVFDAHGSKRKREGEKDRKSVRESVREHFSNLPQWIPSFDNPSVVSCQL